MNIELHEQNCAVYGLELLGIVETLRKRRCYLQEGLFIVHTNHHPLKYLERQEFLTSRQVFSRERLAPYEFDIAPIKIIPQDKNPNFKDPTNTAKNYRRK